MNKKTVGLIALIATIIFCGCTGLMGIVYNLFTIRNDPGGSLLGMVGNVIQIAIPVGVYFLFVRSKSTPANTSQGNSPLSQPSRKVVQSTGDYSSQPTIKETTATQQKTETMYYVFANQENHKLLFDSLKQAANKAPTQMEVYLANIKHNNNEPIVICSYPTAARNERTIPDIDKWVEEASALKINWVGTNIYGPRTHGPEALYDGCSFLESFTAIPIKIPTNEQSSQRMSYDKVAVAKAKEIVGKQIENMDVSKFIGSKGFNSKQEVEAAFLIAMLLKTTGNSLDSNALIEIMKDYYGSNDERAQEIVRLAKKAFGN